MHLDRVCADRDLFPVRAVTDGDAWNCTRPTSAQVNDASRKLGRRDTSGSRSGNVGECWNLNLLTRADFLEAARNFFAHNVMC